MAQYMGVVKRREFLYLLNPAAATACKCSTEDQLRKLPDDHLVIAFRGSVTHVEVLPDHPNLTRRHPLAATFRVDEVWRGDVPARIVIHSLTPKGGDCDGFHFRAGEERVVYALPERAGPVYPKWGPGFYRGWSDVVPEGTRIFVPVACYPQGLTRHLREHLRRLGPGHPPAVK